MKSTDLKIRKAKKEEANQLAEYLFLAMDGFVYTMIAEKNREKAIVCLAHFCYLENNQYSYQNCWVVELNGEIIAAANVYNGADLLKLRKPVIDYIRENYNPSFNPGIETEAGEFYIDTFAVHLQFQGKGIGLKILEFLIEEYVVDQKSPLGLLVESDNVAANKLYTKAGFCYVQKREFLTKVLDHLQIKPEN
jgi:ribosomal protein S18 acetylase RimI-like enzyme